MNIVNLDTLKKGDEVLSSDFGLGVVTSIRYYVVYVLFDGHSKSMGVHYDLLSIPNFIDVIKDGVK